MQRTSSVVETLSVWCCGSTRIAALEAASVPHHSVLAVTLVAETIFGRVTIGGTADGYFIRSCVTMACATFE